MKRTYAPNRLDALRSLIARWDHNEAHTGASCLSLGISGVGVTLPAAALASNALHEVAGHGPEVEHGSAAALFAASLLARQNGPVLWVLSQRDLFAPALTDVGLSMSRVLFVEAGKQVLLAMEEGLAQKGLAGVIAELSGRLTLTASRRLQLAAERSGVTALLIRRSRRFDDPVLSEPSAASTRWRIACLPAGPPLPHAPDVPGLGQTRWRLDLVRCRGGEPRSWVVETGDAQGGFHVVSDLGNRPAAAEPRRAAG